MSKENNRPAHCRACDQIFNAYKRTVEGPDGPMTIEEDLCQLCRRKVLAFFDLEDSDEDLAAKESADHLYLLSTGRRREDSIE